MKITKITECTRVPLVLTVSIAFHSSHTMKDAPYLLSFFTASNIFTSGHNNVGGRVCGWNWTNIITDTSIKAKARVVGLPNSSYKPITNTALVRAGFVNYKKRCTRLAAAIDKVYHLLAHGRWFSPGAPASSTTNTGRHDIAEILLKVALNTINQSIKTNESLKLDIHCMGPYMCNIFENTFLIPWWPWNINIVIF